MKKRDKLLILGTALIGVIMLTGCDNSNITGTGTIKQGMEAVETEVKDSDVTMNVMSALFNDPVAKNFEINVVTRKGDVRLTGVVENQDQIDYLDKLARSAKGAHTLHNHLTIKT